jgi:YVTN family beta-propeller protein
MLRTARTASLATLLLAGTAFGAHAQSIISKGTLLAQGQSITPQAAPGSIFQPLNPGLADFPTFDAGYATDAKLSPDGRTLLVLTGGYNKLVDANDNYIPADSNDYVFVYDVTAGTPRQTQVVQVPNTFNGLAFAPDGRHFYVTGGVDDDIHTFALTAGAWTETGTPIALGHIAGNGLLGNGTAPIIPPSFAASTNPREAAGIAITADGARAVVANFENDSLSVVTLATGARTELDLRPGQINAAQSGVAGGEFPFGVAIRGDTVYVSSVRDSEIDVVDISAAPTLTARIPLAGAPNKIVLNRAGTRLYVAADNSDTVSVIDTGSNRILNTIRVAGPLLPFLGKSYRGSNPNNLALSPDERTLYVTEGGINALAVVSLPLNLVVSLIPTGHYPNAVAVSADGHRLFVANGKSPTGPDTTYCTSVGSDPNLASGCANLAKRASNEYVLQQTRAGLLSLPVPAPANYIPLTVQTGVNANLLNGPTIGDEVLMAALRQRIHHVIYIVKENRTYDEILGDLPVGNGDPSLAEFPASITPNLHAIATRFVDLDNTYCAGDVSASGWPWSVQARTTDMDEKIVPENYAGRGFTDDSNGLERDINIAFPSTATRQPTQPLLRVNSNPNILPGNGNIFNGEAADGTDGADFIWNAVIDAGLPVRNYGFFIDITLYQDAAASFGLQTKLLANPAATNTVVAVAADKALLNVTDPYFRGFDNKLPDFYRYQEWAREFDAYAASRTLPAFEMVRFMHDHIGDTGPAAPGFEPSLSNVNTPELDVADNDYAVGLLLDHVAHSAYADSTVVFVIEDDSQDGPDHVDAHRTIAFVAGAYVKHNQVVSTRYNTVNMLRTMEDILGVGPLNLHDATARPMSDVFDLNQASWTYTATPSVLLTTLTTLPIASLTGAVQHAALAQPARVRDVAYWTRHMKGFTFTDADENDEGAFNRVVWAGMMGGRPYPTTRSGADLRRDRATLLANWSHRQNAAKIGLVETTRE